MNFALGDLQHPSLQASVVLSLLGCASPGQGSGRVYGFGEAPVVVLLLVRYWKGAKRGIHMCRSKEGAFSELPIGVLVRNMVVSPPTCFSLPEFMDFGLDKFSSIPKVWLVLLWPSTQEQSCFLVLFIVRWGGSLCFAAPPAKV